MAYAKNVLLTFIRSIYIELHISLLQGKDKIPAAHYLAQNALNLISS